MTLYDKEKGRLQKIADEGEKQPSKHPISSSIFEQDRPKEASWYIKMMIARLLWCRFRLMTSPTTIVCKARAPTREQKPLSACIDCEDYQHDPLR